MAQQQTLGKLATSIRNDNGKGIIVRYHQTDILTWNQEEFTLNTGGWFTATTKTRMNQASNQFALGYHVIQVNGQWYVDYANQRFAFEGNSITINRQKAINAN